MEKSWHDSYETGATKDVLESSSCRLSPAGRVPLRIVCFPSQTPVEKTKFAFASGYQLEFASGLKIGFCEDFPWLLVPI